jgi:hypothetical protein
MLDDAEKILTQLDEVAGVEELDSYTVEELTKLLIQGREMVRVMRDISGRIEGALVRAMPHRKMTIEGIGVLEKTTETTRKEWDHPLVASRVANTVTDTWKHSTGEVLDGDLVAMFLKAFSDAARMEWRVTALRDMGIDPDKYCQTTYGSQKVRITRA